MLKLNLKEDNMIHECQITYVTVDEKGNDKNVKESYVIENLGCFAEVEELLVEEFGHLTAFDVTAIKRSKVKEVANSRTDSDEKIWLAELMDIFLQDDGSEKQMKYKILFFSKTFDSAKQFISEYCAQGYNMSIVNLKMTNFLEVLG